MSVEETSGQWCRSRSVANRRLLDINRVGFGIFLSDCRARRFVTNKRTLQVDAANRKRIWLAIGFDLNFWQVTG